MDRLMENSRIVAQVFYPPAYVKIFIKSNLSYDNKL